MAITLSTAARNASTDAITAIADSGTGPAVVKIYSGSKPASPQDAATGTLLATVTLGDPSFAASANGTATGTDPASVNAVASGTAAWFRLESSSGAAVFDGTVTATGAGGDMQLSSTALTSGAAVDLTAVSHTTPA